MQNIDKDKIKVWSALIALWIIIGSTYLAIKVAIDTIAPLLMAAIRYSISGGVLLSIYIIITHRNQNQDKEKQEQQPGKKGIIISKQQWKDALIVGTALMVGGQGLLVLGEQYLASGITALLFSTVTLWTAILGIPLFKQKLSKNMVIAILAGFAGLLLLIAPSLADSKISIIGIVLLIISAFSWSLGSLYSKRPGHHLLFFHAGIFGSTGLVMLVGGVILFGISFLVGEMNNVNIANNNSIRSY